MSKVVILLAVFVCAFSAMGQEVTQGSLFAVTKKGVELGACPLKHTSVKTDISGFVARVRVVQEFENNFSEPIEAVYTFPLSQNGAVDDMTMKIGDRTISGKIMKKEEARAAYETARSEGKTASLLDQQRPNIFTQAVANIMPGDKVTIEISYVETLKYEDGSYEFVFPMVVGPRYIPASQNKTDAKNISPPVAAERAGHDISVEVNLNSGVPVEEIRSVSHAIEQINYTPNSSKVTLKDQNTIPNKDFILRYDVSGKRIEDAVLVHRDERGGFFTLILQPPDKIATEDRTPKEIVFVLDTSGSMYGFPLDKAKEAMKMSLEGLYPDDTFNLITFSGDTAILFDKPVPATQENLDKAQAFLDSRQGGGGTEMMKAIKASMDPSDSSDHLRVVCFMTDGYVGNDNEIIAEIQKHPNARVFSFGIGQSVNRFLLDKMASEGKGEVEYVTLTEDGTKAARKFYERVRTPLLTDISIDWNGMPVADVYPNKLTDLFSAKPVIVHGRYTKASNGTIKLRGKIAGQPYEREIKLDLPEAESANDSLASLWARTRIDELTSAKTRTENTAKAPDIDKEIASLGIEYRLLTDFTSFVAVQDKIVNQNGTPRTIQVPVEIPEGVNRATTIGDTADQPFGMIVMLQKPVSGSGGGGGGGGTTQPTVNSTASQMVTVTSADVSSLPVNGRSVSNAVVVDGVSATDVSRSKAKRASGHGSGNGVGHGSGGGSGSGSGGGIGNGNGAPPLNASQTVNVTSGDRASVASGAGNPQPDVPPSPEVLRDNRLKAKLHAWVYALVTRLDKKDSSPGPNEAAFVRDGKASIRIELTDASPETLEKLKALGFELQDGDTTVKEQAASGKSVAGQIAIEKLAALADLDAVNLILPKL